jgi:hypothetical protein
MPARVSDRVAQRTLSRTAVDRDFPAGEDFGTKGHRADVTSLSKFLAG